MAQAFFLGKKRFFAESDSYCPEEDSFLLFECLEKEVKANPGIRKGLDIGCGSGIQGLGMALQGLEVVCVDIEKKALANARNNFESQGLKGEFKASDLFSKVEGKFDLIAFNPPYLASERVKFKDLEGGRKGREVLDRFLDGFPKHLNKRGLCLFLQTDLNGLEETEEKLEKKGFGFRIVGRKKLFFEELLVFKAWQEPF